EWELLPSEYFARQVYTTYWFETVAPTKLLGEIPVDRILFETDFPHPTCLFGNVHEKIEASLAGATDEQRRRILWANAAELYRVDVPQGRPGVTAGRELRRGPSPPVAWTRRGRPTSRPGPT